MLEFRATTQNFSPAIIELDAAMRSGRLRHDGNPVLEWCLSNVVGKANRQGNLYPTKSRPNQKIDAAVALMMAIGGATVDDDNARVLRPRPLARGYQPAKGSFSWFLPASRSVKVPARLPCRITPACREPLP